MANRLHDRRTSFGRLALGALGYLAVTFALAYTWHLVWFRATYEQLGYFSREEPIIAFGCLAILLQGLLLSGLYPVLARGDSFVGDVLRFAAVMGGYHWTTHVLAEAAKHAIEPLTIWFLLETTYLILQFVLGGFLLGLVHRNRPLHETGDRRA